MISILFILFFWTSAALIVAVWFDVNFPSNAGVIFLPAFLICIFTERLKLRIRGTRPSADHLAYLTWCKANNVIPHSPEAAAKSQISNCKAKTR